MSGRAFPRAGERRSHHGDFVWLTAADGSTFTLPKRWTSEATPDPFERFAEGRAHFRMDDLVELVALLAGLGQGRRDELEADDV